MFVDDVAGEDEDDMRSEVVEVAVFIVQKAVDCVTHEKEEDCMLVVVATDGRTNAFDVCRAAAAEQAATMVVMQVDERGIVALVEMNQQQC